jgi:vitamin-K-epoxide reductase (warfarin-sensitive)
MILYILGAIGILLCLYLIYVDIKLKKNKNYKAICDINNKVSCTGVAKGNYSNIFGISNSLVGLGYYFLVIILSYFGYVNWVFFVSILALLMTFYLIYVSYFKLKKYCLVCNVSYVVNILILVFSYLRAF